MIRSYLYLGLLLPLVLRAQQISYGTSERIVVTESRQELVCGLYRDGCTVAQVIVAQVGERKLELRLLENRPEPLLALGTYPGQRIPGKSTLSYRMDESYQLTYPDGKTERFDVIGILRKPTTFPQHGHANTYKESKFHGLQA